MVLYLEFFSRPIIKGLIILSLTLGLCACSTTSGSTPKAGGPSDPNTPKPGEVIAANPILTPNPTVPIPPPPPPSKLLPEVPIYELPKAFGSLKGWLWTDLGGAMASFQKSCESWQQADPNAMLNVNLPQYGRYSDWLEACTASKIAENPHRFFEAHFTPVMQATDKSTDGLLTGYYEPEMQVRLLPDAQFYEPILSKPNSETVQKLPREKLSTSSARVIAYGRPIDVFFLQIQGSGRLKFEDGKTLRAAYAGNNGHQYKSIGKILIARGELTAQQASKQAIEDWMTRNGRKAARELMNENPRYIYFVEQIIEANEGPRGAMGVPLTAMSSIAVDPRYHPYGVPVWLDTILPQKGGDFRGKAQSVLVMAQDTGSAIGGPLRGDLFFGSGQAAGARAGVMKHRAVWSVFLPKALALKSAPAPSS